MVREQSTDNQWVTMTEAAKEIGISPSKISRLAALGRIETKYDPYDERTKLVNLPELKRLFPPSIRAALPIESAHCIYLLIDPRDNTVRYVGRTQNPPKARFIQHLNNYYNGDGRRYHWIEDLKQNGLQPIMKVIEERLTPQEADERETYWIKHYLKRNAPLTNISKART